MASLSDILRGALSPNEYNMGRDLDEEERRQIEELRAQGIYVPQERKVSPFRYGAGAVRQQNLADMRATMQPEQDRRMKELMWQRGRGSRDAAAKELRQQQRKGAASQQRGAIKRASSPRAEAERRRMAVEKYNEEQVFADQLRKKNRTRKIAEEQRIQHLSGLPTMSAGKRYDLQEGGSMPYRSKEAYVEGATPRITDPERAELAVLQRENLPSRIQEQSLRAQQQAGRTQELAHQVGLINLEDQRAASQLSAQVREALPADYAQALANKQVVSTELAVLLDSQRLKTQQKYGDQLAEMSVDKQINALDLELQNIQDAKAWLTETQEGQVYRMQGGKLGTDYLNVLRQLELALSNARDRENRSRIADRRLGQTTPSDSTLEDALGGEVSIPFSPIPPLVTP